MKKFMDEDFLLKTETAKSLYHRYAESQPIIDYHCHLSPRDIAEDRNFKNLFQAWLEGDHYKWRAMRTCGISEYFITGKATDWEKFTAWAETVPQTLRNPLYHWTHLELRRYFGITTLLSPETSEEIYTEASRLLQTPEFSVKNLLRKRNVKIVCTTDDPVDDLRFHKQIKQEVTDFQVLPTFRPDQSMKIADPAAFKKYVAKLSEVTGLKIESYSLLIEALKLRHNYFHENGCRISDHGVESLYSVKADAQELDEIIMRTLDGESPRAGDAE
ncbi:MAG TPA: glucuronate isomerase, partial [Treponemataceae bacterium]|nr:glucuronate isomerase [Treponemataceae bacterium]